MSLLLTRNMLMSLLPERAECPYPRSQRGESKPCASKPSVNRETCSCGIRCYEALESRQPPTVMSRGSCRSGREAGEALGYTRAADETAAAAWANSPEGQLAYELAKAGSMRELATCGGKGWVRRGPVCVPKVVNGVVTGWRLPAARPEPGATGNGDTAARRR